MNVVLDIVRAFDTQLIALLLAIPRMHAFLGASQLLNNGVVPGGSRNATILAMLLFIAPANLAFAETVERSLVTMGLLIVKEYAIGFVAGWLAGYVFWALSSAGALIDNQRGTSIASSMDPMLGEESSLLGNLFSLAFVTYAFTSTGMLHLFGALYHSYVAWPVGKMIPALSPAFATDMLGVFDLAMKTMVLFAGPIVAVMFLAEFALAMVSRFSPQVQVFVLAMPIKSLLAIMMLVFYGSIMLRYADRLIEAGSRESGRLFQMMDLGAPAQPETPR